MENTTSLTAVAPLALSSYGRRILAALLDLLFLLFPCWIVGHIIPVVGPALVVLFYSPIFESSLVRATIGKHLCGIQVSDTAGRRITFGAAFIRLLVKLVSPALAFIPYLFALFTKRRQALHDLVADTVVVYGRVEEPLWDAWYNQSRAIFRGAAQTVHSSGKLADLERLQALRQSGALSEEEFQLEKQRILGQK